MTVLYIYIYITYIQHNGNVSLEKKKYILTQKHWLEHPRFLLWIVYCNIVLSDEVRNTQSRIKRRWT